MSEPRFPFLDTGLPLEERIDDLLSRMTLAEKVTQMLHEAPAIERLGIPAYSWWNEALHGIGRAGLATIFPQAIGLAATFDRELIRKVASAISDEARAKYEVWLERGTTGRYCGLTFWTPNINIFRDPRWGRGQETYGEDPYLTGEIGLQFVRGLQGDDPRYLKTAACAKHFAVHSGPEKLRHSFDARASAYDLEETYLPAFRKLVMEGRVESVMGAYNRTNGEPCCGSEFLLKKTLREDWGFRGHVVSDCWALDDFHAHHKVTATAAESAALALKNGCDLNCGCTFYHLTDAVAQGLATEAQIDAAVRRLLSTRFRLGEFDPRTDVKYRGIGRDVVNCPAHVELSHQAALQSMVLLKNDGILPLDKNTIKSLYIAGPNAIGAEPLLGNYHGVSPRMVTFVEGITAQTGLEIKSEFRHGCLLAEENRIETDWASLESREHDVTVVCLGLNNLLEGEEGDSIAASNYGDRVDLDLPRGQHKFLMKVLESGKPIVLVVSAGSPIDLSPYLEKAAAIVYTWYPGEQGGTALGELLFGKADFSGKLPLTFPKALGDLPAFEDYGMAGRTYRYAEAEPLFPFGFGLGYRQAEVTAIKADRTVLEAGQTLTVEATVNNAHDEACADVVQCYLRKEAAGFRTARRELAGFERVIVPARSSIVVKFPISAGQSSCVGEDGARRFAGGLLDIWVGTSQPDARSRTLGAPAPRHLQMPMIG